MAQKIRVLVVDDDPTIPQAFQVYFNSTDDIVMIATARNGREALDVLRRVECDVVLSDIRMPDMNGIDLLRAIQRYPDPPTFVAITGFDTDETMLQVLTEGGSGYILKSSRSQEVIDAIRDAVAGGTALSPACVSRLVGVTLTAPEPPARRLTPVERARELIGNLTDREEIIIRLVCDGQSNNQIAKELHYSESTVKRQLSSLLKRFGVSTRVQLTLLLHGSS